MRKTVSMAMAIAAATLTMGQGANAAVALDSEGKVKVYGDIRLRAEYDDREYTSASAKDDDDRDRMRYRVRFGVKWQPMDDMVANIRFSTNTKDPRSPHVTMGGTGSNGKKDSENDFGVDRVSVTYTGLANTKLVAGIDKPLYWQQTELFWDDDINTQGLQGAYQLGPVTFNATYGIIDDESGSGENDAKVLSGQVVFKQGGFTVAGGYAGYSDNNGATFQPEALFGADGFSQVAAQFKTGDFLFGVDYQESSASEEDVAYVVQARYNIGAKDSVRLYYWHVEANAAHYSQDDFRYTSNFDGPEFQYKHKFNDNASYRFRLFSQDTLEDDASKIYSNFETMAVDVDSNLRIRLDLDVKF